MPEPRKLVFKAEAGRFVKGNFIKQPPKYGGAAEEPEVLRPDVQEVRVGNVQSQ